MSKSKLVNTQGKGPVRKAKSDRFEVSTWRWTKIVPQPKATEDFFPEREFTIERACIRYSQWNRGSQSWEESSIWCDLDDLRSLAHALDKLNDGGT